MDTSRLLGKLCVALGGCMVLLSMAAFVNHAFANCESCFDEDLCEMEMPTNCGAVGGVPWECTGGVQCWLMGNCHCKTPLFNDDRCHCG